MTHAVFFLVTVSFRVRRRLEEHPSPCVCPAPSARRDWGRQVSRRRVPPSAGRGGRASACPALVAPRPAPRPVLPLALSTVKAPFAFVNNNPMQSFCNKQIQTIAPCIPQAQRQDPRKTPPATSNSPEGPRGQGGIRQPVLCHHMGRLAPSDRGPGRIY